jgi:hypothetical protein
MAPDPRRKDRKLAINNINATWRKGCLANALVWSVMDRGQPSSVELFHSVRCC